MSVITREDWNNLSPSQRADEIRKINAANGTNVGISNSESTYDNISNKLRGLLGGVGKKITTVDSLVSAREKVVERLANILDDTFGLDNVSEDDDLSGLGLDSLDRVEFVMEIEEEFNKSIPDEVAETLETYQAIIDYVTAITTGLGLPSDSVEPVAETYEALDLLISFDDTGSMYSVRQQVRTQIITLLQSLYEDIPQLRVGIIIHNDYCDMPKHIYVQPLTDDRNTIESFVRRDSPCGGGDAPECYELALHEGTKMNWSATARKAFIVIGDEVPHHRGYTCRGHRNELDWTEETRKLNDMGIPVYGVQALGRRHATQFYSDISQMTGGIKLDLSQFQHIVQYIKAVAYHQSGQLDSYEESDPAFKTNLALKNMFNKLRGGAGTVSSEKMETLSKFQVMTVPFQAKIKAFVEDNGCTFQRGKGYYQLITRTEDGKANHEIIQANKEVLFVDKETGEVNNDTNWCRNKLGVPFGTKGTVRGLQVADVLSKYDVFIQSNSYTRNLDKGTKFLYELDAR